MKTFSQLSRDQQVRAKMLALETLVESVLEGVVEFTPILKENRERLKRLLSDARKSEHHAFAKAFILEDEKMSNEFKGAVMAVVEGAFFTDEGMVIMDAPFTERNANA